MWFLLCGILGTCSFACRLRMIFWRHCHVKLETLMESSTMPPNLQHWMPDFSEDEEPSMVPVWIVQPGLPPNFYHEFFLRICFALIGKFIRRDNPTRCVTCTDGARLCVEMDVAQESFPFFWIGVPGLPSSCKQEIIYETLPTFCCRWKVHGHNSRTCHVGKAVKVMKCWVRHKEKLLERIWKIRPLLLM